MLRTLALTIALFGFIRPPARADEHPPSIHKEAGLNAIIKNLVWDNAAFVKSHMPGYFKNITQGQHPRTTVVTCSDSRVHTHALDKTPDGDLFMVRNIGNQLATAEGSVEYGVHHLQNPIADFHRSCSLWRDHRRER